MLFVELCICNFTTYIRRITWHLEDLLSKLAHYGSVTIKGITFDLRYWRLSPSKAQLTSWDGAVHQASEEYSQRMVCLTFIMLDDFTNAL